MEMTAHSYRLDHFAKDGMKVVTSDAGLASLTDARVQLAGVEEIFPIKWIDIIDGIPTVHFELPVELDFKAFVCAAIEHFPDTGKIRKIYFVRRMRWVTS